MMEVEYLRYTEYLRQTSWRRRVLFLLRDVKVDKIKYANDSKCLFLYSHGDSRRENFDQMMANTYRAVSEFSDFINLKYVFNVSFLAKIVFYCFKSSISTKALGWDSLYKANYIINSKKILDLLESINPEVVITFCDCFPLDSLISSQAKKIGKITCTLQHGIYYVSKENRVENIALKNFSSDFMLSWGNSTAIEAELAGIKKEKIIPIGRMDISLRPNSKKKLFKNSEVDFKVYLNSPKDFHINISMIDIVNNYCETRNLKFTIQCHPNDSFSNYRKYLGKSFCATNEVLIRPKLLAVVATSGVVTELIDNNIGFAIFDFNDIPSTFKKMFITFSSKEGFINVVNLISSSDFDYFRAGDLCVTKNNNLLVSKFMKGLIKER